LKKLLFISSVFIFSLTLMAFNFTSTPTDPTGDKKATPSLAVASAATIDRYIVGYNNIVPMKFMNDEVLFREGWHNLPQARFWQQIMNLPPDSAVVNIGNTRQVLDKINIKQWNKQSDVQHALYKDSVRKFNNIPDSVSILVTTGKKDFYEFKKVMPTISRSIEVFKANGVDPWYAQAILLIESPGKSNTKSCVGANGPFQLMKSVARAQGLKVNKTIDERTDVERAAYGAARLLSRICIPYTRAMLDSAHVAYNETDLWFRLLVMHSYHAGAGNVAGVIRKINPTEGGMQLIQKVWQTTYGGFKNSSQNYSQLVLAAFANFDAIVMPSDSVYLIDGDRMYNSYAQCKCAPYDKCSYLGNCLAEYENDLMEGVIPFDYFIEKIKSVQTELSGLAPDGVRPASDERYNDIAFQLLKAKKTEEAFKMFKFNESQYPESWSTYHGLGEAYRMMGQKEQARAYYKKSLKLNPNNEESLKAMARLNAK
jgi:tetratricopeptide (TPR) repeat protein